MILTLLTFLFVLSILVMIHELGHYLAARLFNIKVEEFGFGLPPRAWGKKVGETIYSINWLPIGGFVRLFGEEEDPEIQSSKLKVQSSKIIIDQERAFYNRPIWQRVIVLTAGVTMNFLLALAIITFLFSRGVFVPAPRVHIEQIAENSPAKLGGLQPNDIIDEINGAKITTSDKLVEETRRFLGQEITIKIQRGANFAEAVSDGNCDTCQTLTFTLTPRKESPNGEGPLGITISNYEKRVYTWYEAPIQGLKESVNLTRTLLGGLFQTLGKLVTFQPVGKDVAGPIGIAQVTGQARQYGWVAVLELMGLLSLNLAIINILPFPALDGGRLLFVVIEAIFGRRIKVQWERTIHQIGMAILLAFILFVTFNDILRLLGKV